MDTEARLEALETRLAFQDETIRSLNEVIATQDQHILRLDRELKQLAARLRELLQSVGDSPVASAAEETPPPHY